MIWIFVIAAIALFGYAVYTHYTHGDPNDGVLKRVWLSVIAAGTAIGAAAVQFYHTASGP